MLEWNKQWNIFENFQLVNIEMQALNGNYLFTIRETNYKHHKVNETTYA